MGGEFKTRFGVLGFEGMGTEQATTRIGWRKMVVVMALGSTSNHSSREREKEKFLP